jgi:hypothetical protein
MDSESDAIKIIGQKKREMHVTGKASWRTPRRLRRAIEKLCGISRSAPHAASPRSGSELR